MTDLPPLAGAVAQAQKEGIVLWGGKLNEQDVREIRAALAKGVAQAELAERYGVSQSMISRIKGRTRWKGPQ